MRARLLSRIKGNNQVKISDLSKRVICSLILDYLKRESFQYTPTVFVPECGASDKLLSIPELEEILHVSNGSESSFLEFIVEKIKVMALKPHISEAFVQTEDSPATGLESRLQQLDLEFINKVTKGKYENVEERIAKYKKECDERMRFEINSEIVRIREVEVSAVRIEEASKYRQMVQKVRAEQEEYWKNQLESLKEREKELKERITIREKDLENREFRQRQQFEKELEILKIKESDMKRSTEIELEAARIQRKSWEQKKIEVESKLKEIENLKINMANKAQEDFGHFKRQFEADFDDEKRKVYNEKYELQALRESLNLELEKIRESEVKSKEKIKELIELNKKLEKYKEETEKLEKELNRNKEELRLVSETSRRDLDLLTFKDQELAAVKNECKAYKDLYLEQKETLKKYEANQQLLFEKIAERGNNASNQGLESEFLAERKIAWKKLEKESLDIKKNIIDVFANSEKNFEIPRAQYRQSYRGVVGKYKTSNFEHREIYEQVDEEHQESGGLPQPKTEKNYENYEDFSKKNQEKIDAKIEQNYEKNIKVPNNYVKPEEKKLKEFEMDKSQGKSKERVEIYREEESENYSEKYEEFISDKDSQFMLEEIKQDSESEKEFKFIEKEINIKSLEKKEEKIPTFAEEKSKFPALKTELIKNNPSNKPTQIEYSEDSIRDEVIKESIESSSHEDSFF